MVLSLLHHDVITYERPLHHRQQSHPLLLYSYDWLTFLTSAILHHNYSVLTPCRGVMTIVPLPAPHDTSSVLTTYMLLANSVAGHVNRLPNNTEYAYFFTSNRRTTMDTVS